MKSAHSCRTCARWLEGEWSAADAAGRIEFQRQMDAGQCDPCAARSRQAAQRGLHESHGETMPLFGALIGCTVCWRVVGFHCGATTFAGQNPCRPNAEITALAEHYWRRARQAGTGDDVTEALVAEFRAALRGAGRDLAGPTGGGRHAAGG